MNLNIRPYVRMEKVNEEYKFFMAPNVGITEIPVPNFENTEDGRKMISGEFPNPLVFEIR